MAASKGQQSKALIVGKASALFNRQGYLSSSIADVMRETGFQKGGIYNHFDSKEDLMMTSFSHAVNTMARSYQEALRGRHGSRERLLAIAAVFQQMAAGHLSPGGCPIMNAAIEADDAHPALKVQARRAMDALLQMVRRVVEDGQRVGEISAGVDSAYVAAVFIGTLEGALMLSKLYEDATPLTQAVHHLAAFWSTELGFAE